MYITIADRLDGCWLATLLTVYQLIIMLIGK